MTLDGRLASRQLLGGMTDPDLGSVRMLSLPNSWNHLGRDHVVAFRVLPISPTQSLVTTKWLVHEDAVEGVDYDLQRLTEVWLATNDQDRRLVEITQAGVPLEGLSAGAVQRRHRGRRAQLRRLVLRGDGGAPAAAGTPGRRRVAAPAQQAPCHCGTSLRRRCCSLGWGGDAQCVRSLSRPRRWPANGTATAMSDGRRGSCARLRATGPRSCSCQELFETPYFCKDHGAQAFRPGACARGQPAPRAHEPLAAELDVVLPISFFERAQQCALQLGGDDRRRRPGAGRLPQEPHPGRSGLPREVLLQPRRHRLSRLADEAWPIGVGICWDQWFPEGSRGHGAASAPSCCSTRRPSARSRTIRRSTAAPHWQRVMQGHAAANMVPVDRVEPDRHRESARSAASPSTARPSSPTAPAPCCRGDRATSEAVIARHLRPRPAGRAAVPPGACSATGAPISTCRC